MQLPATRELSLMGVCRMLALALSCLLLTATATDISEILLDLPYDLPDSYAPRTVKVPSVRHAHRMLVQTGVLPVSAADPPVSTGS